MGRLPKFTGREYEYGADPTMLRTLDGHIAPTESHREDPVEDPANPHTPAYGDPEEEG